MPDCVWLQEEAQVSLFTINPFEQWMSSGCPQLTQADNGGVVDTFLSTFTKSNGMVGARVLVVTRDHRLSLVQNGKDTGTMQTAHRYLTNTLLAD